MLKRIITLGIIGLVAAGSALAQAQTPSQAAKPGDTWARLNFLVGEWVGIGSGAPGEGEGGTSFAFGLGGKVLIRKNWAKYPPKQGEATGLFHEDLLVIYPEGGGGAFRAIYFDNEGHVIQYALSFPQKPNAVVFETPSGQPGPRFRMTYELNGKGVLDNVFYIAPPGGDFRVYVQGALKKK